MDLHHPHFDSHDVTCTECGADNLSERDLRVAGGCIHCTCPECGEASDEGAVCSACQPVTTKLRWQSVQLHEQTACPCVAPATGRHYALVGCPWCHGAGVAA